MKICKKFIMVILIVMAIMFCSNAKAMATTEANYEATTKEFIEQEPIRVAGIGEIIHAGNEFIKNGETDDDKKSVKHFAEEFAPIGSVLAAVGVIIFLAVLAIMGIKWVTAKPDQKAKLQQQFIGYVVAAIVFFGAVGIWNMVKGIMNDVETKVREKGEIIVQNTELEEVTIAKNNIDLIK